MVKENDVVQVLKHELSDNDWIEITYSSSGDSNSEVIDWYHVKALKFCNGNQSGVLTGNSAAFLLFFVKNENTDIGEYDWPIEVTHRERYYKKIQEFLGQYAKFIRYKKRIGARYSRSFPLDDNLEESEIKKEENPLKHQYEGVWILSGEFSSFQGDSENTYSSMGRLIILWENNTYKTIYCYSVSREYDAQNIVTAICDGFSTVEEQENGNNILVAYLDIIGITLAEYSSISNKHFYLVLTPVKSNGQIIKLISHFKTKNTNGTLTFIRGN